MKSRPTHVAVSAASPVFAATLLASEASSQTSRPAPVNQLGAPVRSADGVPIRYTYAQMSSAAATTGRTPLPSSNRARGAAALTPTFGYAAFGNGVGLSDIVVSDGTDTFNVGAIDIADADGDGTDELIVGDAQWGNVHAYDMLTQQPLWSINNPEHGTTNVTVSDVDGDGRAEVLWSAGATSSGDDRLYVGDAVAQQIEWQKEQLDGPFVGPVVGDVDGDGTEEFVAVSWSSDAGYGSMTGGSAFSARSLRTATVSSYGVLGFEW